MTPKFSWMNGRLVPWEDSTLHIGTEAVLRGASVFEGIRAYRTLSDDLLLFRVADHLDRLVHTSMRFLRMQSEYAPADLIAAICTLVDANEVRTDAHIRVVVYFDELRLGRETEAQTGAFVLVNEGLALAPRPLRVTLSPWRRLSDVAMPPRVKVSANYVNSRIVTVDAHVKGFDTAVMLNDRGKVSEGPGMNLFLVRGGKLVTPRVTDGILEGITRDTVIRLAGELSIPVEQREVDATELYVADELFFCGTAYEVAPIAAIDGYDVGEGKPGPITERVRDAYFDLVRGNAPAPEGWLTSVRAVTPRR